MLDELRAEFLPEFTDGARTRLRTAISLIPPAGPGGAESAQSIVAMMHTIAGEAMLIGCTEVAQQARTAGTAARRYLETQDGSKLVACARALRSLSRAVDELVVPAATSAPGAAPSATSGKSEGIRVLVVDDSPLNATLLREGLASEGFDVSSVGDDFALILNQLETLRPDVLLVDWFMPGCDTRELCRQIQNSPTYSQTRVLLVTSLPAVEAETHARALGIAGALSKEEGVASIGSRVRALVERPS